MTAVIPLRLGTLDLESPIVAFGDYAGETRAHPVWAWLVRMGDEAILVDSGTPRPAWCADNTRPVRDATDDELFNQLAAHGLKPADIRLVILTHLHWDHCGGLGIFDHAEVIVQQRESAYAEQPLWMHEGSYRFVQQFHLDREPLRNAVSLDGDTVIRPDIEVIATPGHTPGSQVVAVGPRTGGVVLAGDTVSVRRNLGAGKDGRIRPGGVFVDLDEYVDSLARLQAMPHEIVPGHDPDVVQDREIYVE